MCSILGIFDLPAGQPGLRGIALEASRRQRHRGPDWSGIHVDDQAIIAHERLAIVDIDSGAQPLTSPDGKLVLGVNGEIYNHRALRAQCPDYEFQTGSDCEVILALYRQHGVDFLDKLNGIYAFVLWDLEHSRYLIARDPIGVMPLYYGRDEEGRLWVASEMKAIEPNCVQVQAFPPGHVLDSRDGEIRRWYSPDWRAFEKADAPADTGKLRGALEHAIHRQLMCDVPYGVLLSGGLDSSLVAAIAKLYADRRVESDDTEAAWWPRLHSFAIGLEGSPDLAAARIAADAIGTQHHEFHYTIDEGLDALDDVIRHIETFDVTTIRASTPMFLLARRIKAMGIKMVLSGEGADEIFGGYLYFHKAPDARAFHEETVRKIDKLHLFDCLRANKSMAAWGVEARVPFLDLEFLDHAMRLDPAAKMAGPGRPEKGILREAGQGLLPDEILWRQKEQFSDGVGYGWIDALKAHAEQQVSDRELREAAQRFPLNPPATKEAYFYRRIFERHFPSPAAAATVPAGPSIACSTPEALAWDESFAKMADPSGRAMRGVHAKSY
ncbi:asparagine synthase B [Wenzhouxiangella marina]|uniref:asparagine synthase (glutamine-hydrolyzing) n=1 Tax=Wenzhouxiangella marina TaxID=1579979 RepID=A0A0K0XYQ4_9GAMM|nr:asparagine synthase B [Wenzhouxiangella marina]AKS42824.1 Asparagine synthetase [Wenzhouxiangella marina]MBB6087497.1 asparagine synthase (glutamine-hydrolyzing) [Wenzhouxiangella marina]